MRFWPFKKSKGRAKFGELAGKLYIRFRVSAGYLWTLLFFCIAWVTCHFLFGLDKEFGEYNTIMSTETSIVLTLLQRSQDKQMAVQAQQLKYILHLLETMKSLLEELRRVLKHPE